MQEQEFEPTGPSWHGRSYLSVHWSVNTTGAQRYPFPSSIASEALTVRPLPALMYGAAMACAAWKNGSASFGALAAISGDSQKSLSAFETKTSALGKTRFPS